MQAVFNTDLHLDWVIHIWIGTKGMYNKFKFFNNVAKSSYDCYSKKISQSHIWACVTFKRFFHVGKFKFICRVVGKLAWPGKLFNQTGEFMVIASVIVEFYLPNELHFDTLVFQFSSFSETDIYLNRRISTFIWCHYIELKEVII